MINVPGNRILIRPDDLVKEKKVEGTNIAIALAYGDDEKRHEAARTEGYVVRLGPDAYKGINSNGREFFSAWCKEDDYVMFAKYSGVFITDPVTKEIFVIVNDEDVLCTINKET